MAQKTKKVDASTLKAIYFIIGILLNLISLLNYNEYQIPAIIGIFVGIFFIVKALS